MSKPSLIATVLGIALAGSSFVAPAAPLTYDIDPRHTDVIASWSHFGFSNPIAHFGKVDGAITYDPDNVGQSSVSVTIPLAGMESHVAALNEHLRGSDFFDAEKYPTITFASTTVEAAGSDRLRVLGDLTLHGVTRPVVLDVTINKLGERSGRAAAGFDATTTILRSEFGMGRLAPNVSDEVQIRITTEALVPKPAQAE